MVFIVFAMPNLLMVPLGKLMYPHVLVQLINFRLSKFDRLSFLQVVILVQPLDFIDIEGVPSAVGYLLNHAQVRLFEHHFLISLVVCFAAQFLGLRLRNTIVLMLFVIRSLKASEAATNEITHFLHRTGV